MPEHPSGPEKWQLVVLGGAFLQTARTRYRLERRTAAVLAYLAVEGETPKYRLSGMLWPDSSEETARGNMRQLLRRLRVLTGTDLIEGVSQIRLRADVSSDVRGFLEGSTQLEVAGELLSGEDYDDAPDFAEWLTGAREMLLELHTRALKAQLQTFEQQGRWKEALDFAGQVLKLEPLSEEGYRAQMRLHHLLGDRGAAAATFERCRFTLQDTLNTTPSAETLQLWQDIQQGNLPVQRPAMLNPPAKIPLSVLRPPALIGRDPQLLQMEMAWKSSPLLFLAGEAGVGRTRLALDFAHGQGEVLLLEVGSGDRDVPYSTLARLIRMLLQQRKDHLRVLEPWVLQEMGRVVPELHPAPVLALRSDLERLRFLDGLHRGITHLVQEALLVLDDLHHADRATLEFLDYLCSRDPLAVALIITCRMDEATPALQQLIQRTTDAGKAAVIRLDALQESEVAELLDALHLPDLPARLVPQVFRSTGGNPLFVVETVRHLLETGQTGQQPELKLPSGRAARIIEKRVERLDPLTLRVAQAAAIWEEDITFEQLSSLLDSSLLEVMDAWEKLQTAQMVQGFRFSHALLRMGVLSRITPAVATFLHRRAAQVLGSEHPARRARHWLAAGEHAQAAPLFLEAATEAARFLQFPEAAQLYQQAARCFEATQHLEEAFEAHAAVFERLWLHDLGPVLDAGVASLKRLGHTAVQQARSFAASSITELVLHRNHARSEQEALRGLQALHGQEAAHRNVQAELLRLLIESCTHLKQPEATLDAIRQATDLLPELPLASQAAIHLSCGAARLLLWQDERSSLDHLGEASRIYEQLGDGYGAAYARLIAAHMLEATGAQEEAEHVRQQVALKLGSTEKKGSVQYFNQVKLGINLMGQHRYREALNHLAEARILQNITGRPAGLLERAQAGLYWSLGALDACETAARAALKDPEPLDDGWGLAWIRLGRVLFLRGQIPEATQAFDQAEDFLQGMPLTDGQAELLLARAEMVDGPQVLVLTEQVLALPRLSRDLQLKARLVQIRAFLQTPEVPLARNLLQQILPMLPEGLPEDPLLHLLLKYQIQVSTGDAAQEVTLSQMSAWLDHWLEVHVPAEHRQDFLNRPTHRDVVKLLRILHT